MRRANHKRAASIHATSPTPSAQSLHTHALHAPSLRNGAIAAREFGGPSTTDVDLPTTEVLDSADGMFVNNIAREPDERETHHRQLAIAIRQRIESRLAGRVRDLVVRIVGNTIILEGRCATYYTKQLAQHAVLGILDDEQLENEIVVAVPR